MTNEEVKKKICDIIAPYVSAYGDDEAIANALIVEGIGYVWDITEKAEKAIASLIKQNKELQHRAEVAERALLTACINLIKDEEDNVNMELLARVVYTNYLRKAERDRAEERKGD